VRGEFNEAMKILHTRSDEDRGTTGA